MTTPHPAGWYLDPQGRADHRYWDGSVWTDQVSREGVVTIDPVHPERVVETRDPEPAGSSKLPTDMVGVESKVSPGVPATPPGAPGEPTTTSRNRTKLVVGGVGVAVLLAVALAVALTGSGGSGGGSGSGSGQVANENSSQALDNPVTGPSGSPKELWSYNCADACSIRADANHVYATMDVGSPLSQHTFDPGFTPDTSLPRGAHAVETIALDAATGKVAWKADVDGSTNDVEVDDGVVLVTTDDQSRDFTLADPTTTVTVFDAATGKKLWSAHGTVEDYASPGTVAVGNTTSGSYRTTYLDARTGKERWSQVGRLLGICDGRAVITSVGTIDVTDPTTGKDVRTIHTGGRTASGQVCGNDLIVGYTNDALDIYGPTTGKKLSTTSGGSADTLLAAGGRVFAIDAEGTLRSIDPSNGKVEWSNPDVADGNHVHLYPWLDGKLLVITDGLPTLVSQASGEATEPRYQANNAWAIARNGIYVAGDSSVALLRSRDLHVEWETDLETLRTSGSIDDIEVGGGRLFVLHQFGITAYR